METKIFSWQGREFVEIVAEGKAGAEPESAARELFERFDGVLKSHRLALDNAARVRVWGRDREARTLATAARAKILSGRRRAASSSFISEDWFDSNAVAGLELVALRPLGSNIVRRPVDFEPARNYLRYLDFDGWFFFSGFTSEASTLEIQTEEVIATIDGALARARTDWSRVVKLSALVQRGQDLDIVRRVLVKAGKEKIPEIEFSFVDGFAGEKYLLEIEATALR
jgi:enamine deaminase RidA (YjgF/YER057c/UK114 family)